MTLKQHVQAGDGRSSMIVETQQKRRILMRPSFKGFFYLR
jgi:hypothetical protein